MNSTDFHTECVRSLNDATRTGYRAGQHAYNCLRSVRPDIANAIVNTDADPFYNNDNLDAFWKKVQELW